MRKSVVRVRLLVLQSITTVNSWKIFTQNLQASFTRASWTYISELEYKINASFEFYTRFTEKPSKIPTRNAIKEQSQNVDHSERTLSTQCSEIYLFKTDTGKIMIIYQVFLGERHRKVRKNGEKNEIILQIQLISASLETFYKRKVRVCM